MHLGAKAPFPQLTISTNFVTFTVLKCLNIFVVIAGSYSLCCILRMTQIPVEWIGLRPRVSLQKTDKI
jgi:hypothetical protein